MTERLNADAQHVRAGGDDCHRGRRMRWTISQPTSVSGTVGLCSVCPELMTVWNGYTHSVTTLGPEVHVCLEKSAWYEGGLGLTPAQYRGDTRRLSPSREASSAGDTMG